MFHKTDAYLIEIPQTMFTAETFDIKIIPLNWILCGDLTRAYKFSPNINASYLPTVN